MYKITALCAISLLGISINIVSMEPRLPQFFGGTRVQGEIFYRTEKGENLGSTSMPGAMLYHRGKWANYWGQVPYKPTSVTPDNLHIALRQSDLSSLLDESDIADNANEKTVNAVTTFGYGIYNTERPHYNAVDALLDYFIRVKVTTIINCDEDNDNNLVEVPTFNEHTHWNAERRMIKRFNIISPFLNPESITVFHEAFAIKLECLDFLSALQQHKNK
jgi:hypothetical protein